MSWFVAQTMPVIVRCTGNALVRLPVNITNWSTPLLHKHLSSQQADVTLSAIRTFPVNNLSIDSGHNNIRQAQYDQASKRDYLRNWGDRSFGVAAPTLWNSHPRQLTSTLWNSHPRQLTSTLWNSHPRQLTSTLWNSHPRQLT